MFEARLDLIEITPDKSISARFVVGLQNNKGEFKRINDRYHRVLLTPVTQFPVKFFCPDVSEVDDDGNAIPETLVTIPDDVVSVANHIWTDEVKAQYLASIQA